VQPWQATLFSGAYKKPSFYTRLCHIFGATVAAIYPLLCVTLYCYVPACSGVIYLPQTTTESPVIFTEFITVLSLLISVFRPLYRPECLSALYRDESERKQSFLCECFSSQSQTCVARIWGPDPVFSYTLKFFVIYLSLSTKTLEGCL
jgi:hypothetical protein